MTYNKEKLLKMLSNAPICNDNNFYENMNDDFLSSLGDNFDNYYNYAYGATKLAIIPKEKDKDYVIKIPYTGSCEYYISSISNHGKDEYYDFCGADDEERPWDYCAGEVNRYKKAKELGFSIFFAETKLLGYVNNYPIYIQEKCETFSSCKYHHIHSEEERSKTSKCCNNYLRINKDWLTDFRMYYGEESLLSFIDFINEMGWDDDLRNENIGYINNRPVLIDYSGFFD